MKPGRAGGRGTRPGAVTDLRLLSATRIAELIRSGDITSRDAVEAHIAQIERVNPKINAVVKDRYDEARREADAADDLRARSKDLPSLHGVPCTIKECFALTGMPNASGLVRRSHIVADGDATAVARLRRAGAIPLGVTNTSELCMWMESDNHVYGRTNNPYDQTRIVGGSSGGEGAIIAAAASPFGLGSDIGGSIRGPCFFNGIFGHKATGGLVPGTGQYPLAVGAALKFLTSGPMCRQAEDMMPILRILAGPDGKDAGCEPMKIGDESGVRLEGRRVIDVPDNGDFDVSPDMRAAQERVARALEDRGMIVERRRFRALKHQADIWSAMMAKAQEDAGGETFGELLGQGNKVRPGLDLLKGLFGRSQHTPMANILAAVDPLPKYFPSVGKKLVALKDRLREEMLEALGEDGVLLYPTYPTVAPRHGVPVRQALRLALPFAHQGIFNVLHFPATQVPLGLNHEGLPLGVQVVSRPGNDHVTLALALELERAFGGWVPPAISGVTSVGRAATVEH